MTTPGGVPNLPVGALTVGTLADRLQNLTQSAMRARAGERMPAIFNSSTGGNIMNDLSPFGIIAAIWAGFNSHVAQADPNDINGPDDLPGLLLDFIEGLPVIGQFVTLLEAIAGTYDGDDETLLAIQQIFMPIRKLLQLVSGQNVGLPTVEEIVSGWEQLGDALGHAVSEFAGILSVSRIGDVIQDLINGAGDFLNAGSVSPGSPWSWDSLMPGRLRGGSIRATANGTDQVMRKDEPFEVFEGQVLKIKDASARWTGASASAGTNPVKIGWTPFDAAGTALPDVIVASFQPSGDSAGWLPFTVSDWAVPAGVKYATPLVILGAGATAGNYWISNVLPYAAGLLPDHLVDGLRDALDEIGGVVGATVTDIRTRLAAITADGKIDAAELENLANIGEIAVGKITGLVEQLAAYALKSAVQTFMDTVGGTVGASMTDVFNRLSKLSATGQINGATGISGALNEAQTGVNAVRDAIANGLGLLGSGLTNLQVQNQATLTAQIAAQAAAAAAAANAQLAKSQGQQNAAGGGLNYTTVFGGADGAALPAEFTGSDLKVRGNNGYAGIAASKPDGTYVVTCNKQCSTDDQSLAVVLGDQGGSPSAPEYHLFHSDSGYTAGACLKIDNGNATIGSYTRSGASITFTAFPGGAWSGALGQGSLLEVHNVGTTWTLAINGNTVLSVTSSAVTFGASTRYGGGVVMVRATVNLGWFQGTVTYDSFRVASITLSDYIDPIYLGSGATMARTSATNVTIATGTTVLPNSFYSVVQSATPDIACNLTNGTMTVSLSGWYLAKLSTKSNIFTNSTNSSGQATPAIFINSTTVVSKLGLPQQYSRSNSSDGSVDLTIPVLSLSDSFVIYLNAGDVVRGGQVLGSNASTRQVTGDSAGTATLLSLALLNRSQI
ncbi:hypothetical protein [Mycobacteroides saopaulense]|uniref:hypothetical protein n=1 Tax=Mycobacteroides saopaulense TaxID=1578165 RepID=UPI001055593D|nr:hypothetical protein [Mycobacteroides saopaulense]